MLPRFTIALAIALFQVLPASAQSCPSGIGIPNNDPTSGPAITTPFGFNQVFPVGGVTYASRIPASFMDPVNPYVNDIAFAPTGTGTWSSGTVIIGIGHLPNPLPFTFNFPTFDANGVMTSTGSFLDLTLAHNSFSGGTPAASTGPFTWNVTQDTWSPMGFAPVGGTGFTWNGADDVGLYVTFQNETVTGWGGGSLGSFHRGSQTNQFATGYNAPACTMCNGSEALKILLQVSPGPGLSCIPVPGPWQVNQSSSSIDVNGAQDPGPTTPMITVIPLSETAFLNLGGLSGHPWDIGVTRPERGIPGGLNGGIVTPGGQIINLDLNASSLTFAFNLNFANSFIPATLPLNFGAPELLSLQQVVLDPAHADGLALSHLNEIIVPPSCHLADFDNLPPHPANVLPSGWSSDSTWIVNTGGTNAPGTGPTAANSLPNYMCYCGFGTGVAQLNTCDINLAYLQNYTITLSLSRIGSNIGTLNIYQCDDNSCQWNLIQAYAGPDPAQSQGSLEWSAESIPFVPGGTSTVAFRFSYSPTGGYGNIGIDDFRVE